MRILVAMRAPLDAEGMLSVVRNLVPHADVSACGKRGLVEAFDAAGDALAAAVVEHPWISSTTLRALQRRQPAAALVVLTPHTDGPAQQGLLASGAVAVVAGPAPPDLIGIAVRLALCGQVSIRPRCVQTSQPIAGRVRVRSGSALPLTARQQDVMRLVGLGKANREIAETLGIGVRTVKGHVAVILRAMHADNRRDAARQARRWLVRRASDDRPPGDPSGTGLRESGQRIR